MSQQLEDIFGELGISQYLDSFVDQGFDSWETILDITESDLDALGVKLGHRRKLQRRIANSRGLAPQASLTSPTRQSIEEARLTPPRPDASRPEIRDVAVVITKRKYRRHPKPDENAPERPPSAYVLFSNKMRDDLKGRNLTFTEIAKLVGENWQNLSPSEKEPFETQAQAAKDKYNHSLAEYKRTPEYKKYMLYLQDFKLKHAHQSQEKDASKRVKLSEAGGGSPLGTGATATPNRTSRSGTGSGSEGHRGSEPPPGRKHRVGSSASMTDARHSPSAAPNPYHTSNDDPVRSPSLASMQVDGRPAERSPAFSTSPRDASSMPHGRNSSWPEVQRSEDQGLQRHLPSFSDMFDSSTFAAGAPQAAETPGFPFPHHRNSGSPGPPPGLVGGESRSPSLRQQPSSTGSSSSGASFTHPRTPIEGNLPIHALLAGKPPGYEASPPLSAYQSNSVSSDAKTPFSHYPLEKSKSEHLVNGGVPSPFGTAQGFHPVLPGARQHVSSPPLPHVGGGFALPPPPASVPGVAGQKPENSLDGMSALLRAGEIVDRRAR